MLTCFEFSNKINFYVTFVLKMKREPRKGVGKKSMVKVPNKFLLPRLRIFLGEEVEFRETLFFHTLLSIFYTRLAKSRISLSI